ncbi:MAG: pilus assembly protein TadG-related protein [Desulfobulbaceae bacterium]|nr:pilus assembly protein TadG-related protein [Desulfobulbaceae bacterium]
MKSNDTTKKGAVAPFVAILLIVLVGCLALVVDLGRLHNIKIQLQRAVDAAALAGALKLDGTANEAQNARTSAADVANKNVVDNVGLILDSSDASDEIFVGTWESGNYEKSAADRFTITPSGNLNAVKVHKSIEISNLIFARIWSDDSTTVAADAIAVTTFEEPGLPIALLSCIPINEGIGNSVCEIKLYKWSTDPDDTAGWTGLTFNTSAQTLKDFFSGVLDINRVLYGENDDHQGLENTAVLKRDGPSGPCGNEAINKNTGNNYEYEINCGLGNDFDDAVTAPEDPLAYDPLPRWYNHSAFDRILSMDGMLSRGHTVDTDNKWTYTEDPTSYQERMAALLDAATTGDYTTYNTSYSCPSAYCTTNNIGYNENILDGRFTRYIEWSNKDKQYIAHPEEALRDAGYPLVQAKNGQDTAALAAFIDRVVSDPDDGHFKDSLTSDTGPFNDVGADANGETLPVTIPVIFSGQCGDWKALKGQFYIGTANLLITRIWKNNHACWDEGENPLEAYDDCVDDFTPTVPSRTFTCVTKKDSGAEAGIEALIWEKGKKDPSSGVLRVELVE